MKPFQPGARLGALPLMTLLAVLLPVGSPPCARAAEAPLARNLILISLDTLRADRLGAYGYPRKTSRNIDALAASGVRFETVIADSGWTLPSHVSLFTGLAPSAHGVTHHSQRMSGRLTVLPEILRQQGFRTVAITGGGFLSKSHGFGRGFEEYEALKRKDLGTALSRARKRLNEFGPEERFFMFIHSYEVHCPYTPPIFYIGMYVNSIRVRPEERVKTGGRCDEQYNKMNLTRGQGKYLSDVYDAGIRYADDLLKGLFDEIRESGRLKDTIVILVSDHGEEFLEHGRIGHTDTLYIEDLRVPWIMTGAGLPAVVISQPVGLSDVLPTILDALGVAPPPGLKPSLLPLIQGKKDANSARPVFSEIDWKSVLRSAVIGDYQLIFRKKSEKLRLYNWRKDPLEKNNLWGSDPALDKKLRLALDAHFQGLAEKKIKPEPAGPLTEQEKEQLRALGYVQ